MDVLGRLQDRQEMFVSFEGRNDRLILDSHTEIESLRGEVERLISANEHWHARIITLKNDCGAYESSIEELEAEVERLKVVLSSIRDLHDCRDGTYTYCLGCGKHNPCPTAVLAIATPEQDTAETTTEDRRVHIDTLVSQLQDTAETKEGNG